MGSIGVVDETSAAAERTRKLDLGMRRPTRRSRRRTGVRRTLEDGIRNLDLVQHGESGRIPPMVKEEDDEEGEECPGLEPFFFDEAEAVAEHEVRALREQEEERLLQREEAAEEAALRKIRAYDPKRGRICSTRIDFVDLRKFDLDEESPLGPMRDTDTELDMLDDIVFKQCKKPFLSVPGGDVNVDEELSEMCKPARVLAIKLDSLSDVAFQASLVDEQEQLFFPCDSANFLSVKIVSSDVGFPINVYGTVLARDMLDRKCVYLFRCDRDHSQLILTKDEQLILTGPKRGLALIDAIYIEIDLKIKGAGKQNKDKQLSKGFFQVYGLLRSFKDDMKVESYTLDSMLSEVLVTCVVKKCAVEATIAIELVQGKFCGEITARTTTACRDSLVLHDSKLMSAEMTGKGVLPLLRNIVAVSLKEKLLVTIARAGVCKAERERTIKFAPSVNGRDKQEVTCGSVKMFVKVAWSIISHHRLD